MFTEIISTFVSEIGLLLSVLSIESAEFVTKLYQLMVEFPDEILKVQGSGLLCSAELRPEIPVVGFDGIEPWCRRRGLGVIHGGINALRFTSHFGITSEEIDLIVSIVREGIIHFRQSLN